MSALGFGQHRLDASVFHHRIGHEGVISQVNPRLQAHFFKNKLGFFGICGKSRHIWKGFSVRFLDKAIHKLVKKSAFSECIYEPSEKSSGPETAKATALLNEQSFGSASCA